MGGKHTGQALLLPALLTAEPSSTVEAPGGPPLLSARVQGVR